MPRVSTDIVIVVNGTTFRVPATDLFQLKYRFGEVNKMRAVGLAPGICLTLVFTFSKLGMLEMKATHSVNAAAACLFSELVMQIRVLERAP